MATKTIDVWNYWIDESKSSSKRKDRFSIHLCLWGTYTDTPKILHISQYQFRNQNLAYTIKFENTIDYVYTAKYEYTWTNANIMDPEIKILIDRFLTSREMVLLGLISERMIEIELSTMGNILHGWYGQSQNVLQRPLVKDHKLRLYLPVKDTDAKEIDALLPTGKIVSITREMLLNDSGFLNR